MSRPSLLAAAISALVTFTTTAAAQEAIAVVPATPDATSTADAEQVANAIRRALRARGTPVLAADEMVRRFRQNHSSEPADVETGVYEELSACADELLLAVSGGRYQHAEQTGIRCRELAEQSLESLNRRTQSAREVLDACLMVVRATLDADSRVNPSTAALESARAGILRCRVMVPDLSSTSEHHTERIRNLLQDVDAELEQVENTLEVDSLQSGCRVYVNGRRLGSTPLRRSGLPQGRYRVQVECGDTPGRVHVVTVRSGSTPLTIDERFDSAVHTPLSGGAARFTLRYASREALARHRFQDALTVGAEVGASEVWTVSPDGAGSWRVDRLESSPCEASASVLVSLDETGDLRFQAGPVAVERLAGGQSADLSAAREGSFVPTRSEACATSAATDAPPNESQDGAGDDGALIAAWTATGVGLAAVATGWSLWAASAFANNDVSVHPSAHWTAEERATWERQRDEIDNLQIAGVVAVAAGVISIGVTMPIWLPAEDDFPWWSLLPAAAGVGLAAWGAALVALDGQCSREVAVPDGFDACASVYASGFQGGLALLSAAPLLEVPLVYLVRALSDSSTTSVALHVQPTPTGASVALEGIW